MLDVGLEDRARGYAQGLVLDALEFVCIGCAGGWEPDWCGVGEYGLDYCFEGEQYCLLFLAPGSSCEGFQDLEAARSSGCYFRDMRGEGEHGVECYSENFGFLVGGDRDVVD